MNESFEQAVEDVKVLKQRPSYGVLSDVYGLYKQATVGDVNIGESPSAAGSTWTGIRSPRAAGLLQAGWERPGFFDIAGRGKWDAWKGKKGLSKEEAMVAYIDLVEDLKERFGFPDIM
ncbi:Acyl-CoA-binding protein [Liparis tanakae]|uniref:Acyl-CoA-binding protein n=1 Tax=Liparis tanakae TaxID=230148 RepID=A0A4Z2GRP8_9TELE|nr:Acyl-CoA-binding protein [Liparis tanakae]